jgi:hypothetical protein
MADKYVKALTAGLCYVCGRPIYVNDMIHIENVDKHVTKACHKHCHLYGDQMKNWRDR